MGAISVAGTRWVGPCNDSHDDVQCRWCLEVWSARGDGGRTVLPGCSSAVCPAAANSKETCHSTEDLSR